jgi:hypothetical protein
VSRQELRILSGSFLYSMMSDSSLRGLSLRTVVPGSSRSQRSPMWQKYLVESRDNPLYPFHFDSFPLHTIIGHTTVRGRPISFEKLSVGFQTVRISPSPHCRARRDRFRRLRSQIARGRVFRSPKQHQRTNILSQVLPMSPSPTSAVSFYYQLPPLFGTISGSLVPQLDQKPKPLGPRSSDIAHE